MRAKKLALSLVLSSRIQNAVSVPIWNNRLLQKSRFISRQKHGSANLKTFLMRQFRCRSITF